ncbi:MAG: hypothetical protein U0359_21690 [Byssovorax sp.]
MRRMLTRALLAGVIVVTAGGAVGCAQERAPINRVQANALAKSFFVGADLKDITDDPEFYMRNTVVDVGYGAAQDGLFTSTYAQPVSRIRWQITEDHLIARLAYERIKDSDAKGLTHDGLVKKTTNDGQIVASYRITSHFDIRRAYNPATGEESNVVEENTSDRTWDQREYMRVDWSQNESSGAYDFDTLSMMGLFGGIKYSPLSYSVLDPADPDAPHFDAEMGYFDVTNKAYAEPALIDLSSLGWGIDTFPACYLPGDFAGGTDPYGNCNPTEITLRQSFKKVVDKDFEAFDVDGFRFEAYGDFQTEYKGYERNYGMIDDRWFRFGDRYNIWERSHYYDDPAKMTGEIACDTHASTALPTNDPYADPNRDLDGDGTADECKDAGKGSRCDIFKGKCTLPYADRKTVTIPWYINGASTAQIDNYNWQIETEKAKDSPDQSKIDELNKQIADAQKAGQDLFEATDWAVQEWDLAMKTAVQSARYVECKKTGGTDCATKFPMWTGQQDDIDEAVEITRELNACYRKNGWESTTCVSAAKSAANNLPAGVPDQSKAGIAAVVGMQSIIVLCHNPVIKGDAPACGAEGLSPRLGDLRYNTVLDIDKPQQPSTWGIMVDGDDPVTGEKVASSINIWTHITDVASQGLVDLVRYMNGELDISEITEGKYIRDWATAQKTAAGAAGGGALMSKDEVNARLAAAAKVDAKTYADLTKNGVSPQIRDVIAQGKAKLGDVAIDADVTSPSQAGITARMNRARGGETESKLINPAMLQIAGIKGNVPVSGTIADMASPLAMNNPKVRSQLEQMKANALAARGACIINEAPEASSLTGIADALKKKFPIAEGEDGLARQARYEKMLRYIRRKYHYAVIAHEMGHSIGLRHNFVSTYASLFFRPQYWQLRTKNGKMTKECTDAVDDGNTCVGPRYFDPVTDEEQSQLIWMYQQSTVMDYPGDVSQDMIGLGVYDFGAARFFYGDTVSVYDQSLGKDYYAGGKVGVGITLATDTFGGLSGISYGLKGANQGADDFHYSQLQKNYKVIDKCYDVTPTAPSWWNADVDGTWDQGFDGHVVSVDGKVQKCRQMPVDYAAYSQLRMPDLKWDTTKKQYVTDTKHTETNNGFFRGGPSILDTNKEDAKAPKLVRVPYAFATDHWADTGNVSVFRHDNGADPYEQVMFLITTQENRHIFDNYRRNRNTFSARAAADRSFSRYNEKLLGISGGIGFYGTIYQDLSVNQGFSFDSLWPLIVEGSLKGNILAATVAFDHFTRELSRPEPGVHYYKDPAVGDPVLHSDSDSDDYGVGANFGPGAANSAEMVRIPNGATGYLRDIGFGGHPLENALSENHGDYDSSYMINAGSYYEKINTAILLSESEDRFISQSRRDFYDARFRAVGMADVLPEGYRRVLANALTGDRSMLAPRIEASKSADPTKRKPVLDTTADNSRDPDAKKYPKRPIGWTSWWPTEGPAVCFPTNGKNICTDYLGGDLKPNAIPNDQMAMVDPQIGWEVQKFLIAWTLAYIPANQKTTWLDQLKIYKLGSDADAKMDNRIEWEDPASGIVYYAATYGKECLFGDNSATDKAACVAAGGQWVQKGIGARVLEWANHLTAMGYSLECTDATEPTCAKPVCTVLQLDMNQPNYCPAPIPTATKDGFNAFGRAVVKRFADGTPVVRPDPAIKDWNASGTGLVAVAPCEPDQAGLNKPLNGCKPIPADKNHYAYQLIGYKSVPDFIRQAGIEYGVFDAHELGLYP